MEEGAGHAQKGRQGAPASVTAALMRMPSVPAWATAAATMRAAASALTTAWSVQTGSVARVGAVAFMRRSSMVRRP
jgi:hypothetical protein